MSRSLRAELRDAADSRYGEMVRRFVLTRRKILGVRIPLLRKTALRLRREGKDALPLTTRSTYEELLIAGMILARAPYPRPILCAEIETYIDHSDSWIYGDVLAAEMKQIKKDPESYWEWIGSLLADSREFHVRFAETLLLNYYTGPDYIDDTLDRLVSVTHSGHYARLGAAWALQRCYFASAEKTLGALDSPVLQPEIRRRALQNIRAACRRAGRPAPF